MCAAQVFVFRVKQTKGRTGHAHSHTVKRVVGFTIMVANKRATKIEEAVADRRSTTAPVIDASQAGYLDWIAHFSTWDRGDAEERAVCTRVRIIDGTVLLLLFAALYAWSRTLEPLPVDAIVTTGAGSVPARIVLALFQLSIAACNLVIQPGPFKRYPDYYTVLRVGGRTCTFFTSQSISVMTVVFTAWPVALMLEDYQLAHALLKGLTLWCALQGSILTLLFWRLNWVEKRWRNELRAELEREFPGWTSMSAYTHFPQFVQSGIDLLMCTKSAALAEYGMDLTQLACVACCYAVAYTAWICYLADSRAAHVYPFVKDLTTVPKRVLFAVAVTVFCLGWLVALNYLKLRIVGDVLVF